MYSRYRNTPYDLREEDDIRDMNEDEYELYRYNLPPRYDGSRFRQNYDTAKKTESATHNRADPSESSSVVEENVSIPPEGAEKNDVTPTLSFPRLTPHGYEDLLIICLILLVTESADSTGDIILLLLLLLAAK